MKVLVTAASRHGSTAEIAAAVGEGLRRRGHEVAVLAPGYVGSLCGYDAVIVGSGLYAGRWLAPAVDLVESLSGELRARPVWLFSSGPVGKPGSRLARKMTEDPVDLPRLRASSGARGHRIFPGRLERSNLRLPHRLALLLFRSLEGDFRDWEEIDRWSGEISASLAERGAPVRPVATGAGA